MKKILLGAVALLFLLPWTFSGHTGQNRDFYLSVPFVFDNRDSALFTLRKGDILVRPNWSWLPGSFPLEGGRKFGHAAVVTEDCSGKTIEAVLAKAPVIEALFYDQATRRFVFDKEGQIREGKADMSFGLKFKGMRYRLRSNLPEEKKDSLIRFLEKQLGGGYDLFSLKQSGATAGIGRGALQNRENASWNCATLIWEAYYLAAGTDIDSNQGWQVFPSDMIASPHFDLPGGRIRF